MPEDSWMPAFEGMTNRDLDGIVITQRVKVFMNSDVELNIKFRFLALSEKQAASLIDSNLACQFGTHFKTKNITGVVPLNNRNISIISALVEDDNISIDDTDIFISFVAEYDTRIIDIPHFVNQAVVELGSRLVLSYTIV